MVIADRFWKRWTKEYLPCLINQSKWHGDNKQITVGDVVVIVAPNSERSMYTKEKVIISRKRWKSKSNRLTNMQ